MRLVTAIETFTKLRDEHRRGGVRVGFVPTMGALHDGHGSLVRRARAECEIVVTSIFVNPLQFGPSEDFDKYPRDLEGDRAKLQAWGADILFTTSPSAMYPSGFQTYISPEGGIVKNFEGARRPDHFRGVATVVLKLLNLAGPDIAYFGRKDAQQAALIKRMVFDLNVPTKISVCETVREADGLAMSSRNIYLTKEQRAAAPGIYKSLAELRGAARAGVRDAAALRAKLQNDLSAIPGGIVDYADLVDPDTFEPLLQQLPVRFGVPAPSLAIAVVKFGATRLLDNLRLDEDGP